jgi:Protein of unknown function (DUF429)/Restriction Endonuclease associating with ARP
VSVLGIDLAASPKKTYACVLEMQAGTLRAELFAACDDDRLLALADGSQKVGIDAPFGWPREFVNALDAHRRFEAWPAPDDGPPETFRAALSFRATDRVTMHTRRPLSVSTDKLGVTAMRCAHLLQRWSASGERIDRSGRARFVEVYPAGALVRWGLAGSGYKGSDTTVLEQLLASVREAVPALELSDADRQLCGSVDDAFDALIAALVARAALLGLTDPPSKLLQDAAGEEGWIHLPVRGSLPFVAALPPTFSRELKQAIRADLSGKGGAELVARSDQGAKFHAAHSSACLAANAFGPWLREHKELPLGGQTFIGETHLEVECPSGLRGTPPTLDCLVDGPEVLAVESKCTEIFQTHEAKFSAAYGPAVAELAHPSWRAEFERLIEDPRRYRFLDAAQLIKHYLGLRRRFTDRRVTLAYLYWEPSNANALAACAVHAAEVEEFSRRVADRRLTFVPMSYRRVWDEWAATSQPTWLQEHAAALRGRYDMAV